MLNPQPSVTSDRQPFRAGAFAVISFLLMVFVSSESGFAQRNEWPYREWEVAGFAGGSFVGNFRFPTPVSGSSQTQTVGMHYASGYQVGLRITENVRDGIAVDVEYSFANQPLRFTNLTPEIPSLSVGHSVQHLSYNVTYLPLSREKRFRPYVSLGAGAVLYHIAKQSRIDAEAMGVGLHGSWVFAMNAGGGFKYLVQDQFALTFDVKDQVSRVPSYGLPKSASVVHGFYQPGVARHGFLNNWQLNIGAVYQWDD
jgi:outer membrane protein W